MNGSESIRFFGILNVTPDSFSDGGKFLKPEFAVSHARKLIEEGANFLDIGGESMRPGARELLAEEEWARLHPVLCGLPENFLSRISLDSRKSETAKKFCEFGGRILNDVSGFFDPKMRELAVKYETVCIINHFPGKTINEVHAQHIESVYSVQDALLSRVEIMMKAGIKKENIILDPGIGFGKTMECNWKLLEFAKFVPDYPVLIGHSKKRFLGEDRFGIEKNVEAAKIAILAGTRFLRVHEIAPYKVGE